MAAEEYDEQSFPEFLYLEAFTDVRDAVASGALANGWQHYIQYGKAEIEGDARAAVAVRRRAAGHAAVRFAAGR